MTRRRKRAYEGTSVTIGRSREEIDSLLRNWGVSGIQWEDDFGLGIVKLRFRWQNDDTEYIARYQIALDDDEKLREAAIDGRSGKPSEKKFERLKAERGKREHRVLSAFLKNVFEAVEQGIIDAEAVFLPWIEDSEGFTVYERIGPVMKQIGSTTLPKALNPSKRK
jgi:hypothetical protein